MSAGRFTMRSSGSRARAASFQSDLVTRLRGLPVGPMPDARFRSELRSQLVSITARIIAESATDASQVARVTTKSTRAATADVLRAFRRPFLAFASSAAVLVMLLGLAVFISGNSLPGDSLYGIKRASENVQLSLAGSDLARGQTYLALARNRAKEAAELLGRPNALAGSATVAAGGISEHVTSLVTETLASADSDSRSGMQLLGKSAVRAVSAEPLSKLDAWLPVQRASLTETRDRIPAGALHDRAQGSLDLLQRISARKLAVTRNLGCPCLGQATSDDLGPLPCTPCIPLTAPSRSPGSSSGSVPIPGGSPVLPSAGSPTLPGGTGGPPPSAPIPGVGSAGLPLPALTPTGTTPPGVKPPGVTPPSQPLPSLPLPSGGGVSLPGTGISVGMGSGGISASLGLPIAPIKLPGLSLN